MRTTTTTKKAVRTTTTTKKAVRTTTTGREGGSACAPETSPTAPRTTVKTTPATPAQLEYAAFLAGETGSDRPDPATLTTRSADILIRYLKKAVRTTTTGREGGSACAPETSPPARRTPLKAKPATAAQLAYVAFLADEVATDQPNPAMLTVRSADRAIQDLKARRALRQPGRDRRCRPVPRTVQAQSDRTDRTAPIDGCPASARRARIDVLEVTLEQWRSRTDPATVQEWERELAELAAAAIAEEDRHREGLRPPGSCAAGSPPATTCNDGRRGRAAKVLAALEQRIRQAAAWVMTGGAVSGPPPG